MKLFCIIFALVLTTSAYGQSVDTDRETLLKLHQTVIDAHVNNDVSAWMALETDSTMSVNEGEITYSGWSERRNAREAYLGRTTFERYEDKTSPTVQVSADGTLGWVVVEVEVVGWTARADGTIEDISQVWAWIELYQKFPQGWKMIGNVSNSRPIR